MATETTTKPIIAVCKALDVMECLGAAGSPLGLAQISKKVGLANDNVLLILRTLKHKGFARQDEQDKRWTLTAKTRRLAGHTAERW
jgi:DNA-binding IclR family transcriptional regulator